MNDRANRNDTEPGEVAARQALIWRLLAGLFVLLTLLLLVEIARQPLDPLHLALALGFAATALLAFAYHREVLALAARQRGETESLNRMLQELSRSTSPDAVVSGIVDELRAATGADHCVVVRRRARSRVLDATLVSGSAGVPATTTTFPSTLLAQEEPATSVAEQIARAAASFFGLPNARAAALVTSYGIVGALVLSRRQGTRWRAGAQRLLTEAAREVSAALERAYLFAATEAAATTDALTGLPNRRFLEILEARSGGRRRRDARGVLLVDIDHFKRLNDRFGHALGDAVLRAVGDTIAATVRTDDFPIRYGGEEFLVVLREADPEIAAAIAERLRRRVAAMDLRDLGISAPVTVSVGIAVAGAGRTDLAHLIERADAALYRAKAAGRDRVAMG